METGVWGWEHGDERKHGQRGVIICFVVIFQTTYFVVVGACGLESGGGSMGMEFFCANIFSKNFCLSYDSN